MQKRLHTYLIPCLIFALSLLSPRVGWASQSPPLAILSPGDGSVVTSPIMLTAEFQPEVKGMLRLALVDRSGHEIARKLLDVDTTNPLKTAHFVTELPFEIPTDEGIGLLTLTTLDSSHRPVALRSVTLNLQSGGETRLQPQTPTGFWLTVTRPQPLETIQGRNFLVEGIVTPQTANPILFELITDRNRVIGSSQLAVENPGQTLNFSLRLYYDFVDTSTIARLVVRQTLEPYDVPAILDSLLIYLIP